MATIIVPTTFDIDQKADPKRVAYWVNQAKLHFRMRGVLPQTAEGHGGWYYTDQGRLIDEPVHIIHHPSVKPDKGIFQLAKAIQQDLKQDTVAISHGNGMWFVNSETPADDEPHAPNKNVIHMPPDSDHWLRDVKTRLSTMYGGFTHVGNIITAHASNEHFKKYRDAFHRLVKSIAEDTGHPVKIEENGQPTVIEPVKKEE